MAADHPTLFADYPETRQCRKCKVVYPASTEWFYVNRQRYSANNPLSLDTYCKKCHVINGRKSRAKNPDIYKRASRNWHQKPENRRRCNQAGTRTSRRLKWAVLCAYSGGKPSCACCGTTHFEFLAIDHIDGGGTRHINHLRSSGDQLYRWLKRNAYPDGFRVLCFNCNFAIGAYGHCPHQGKAITPDDFRLIRKPPPSYTPPAAWGGSH